MAIKVVVRLLGSDGNRAGFLVCLDPVPQGGGHLWFQATTLMDCY